MRVRSIKQDADSELAEEPLEGVRGEYLKAVRANEAAKRRYEDALRQARQCGPSTKAEVEPGREASPADLLVQHTELIRAQRQHSTLVVLQDELDALKLSRGMSKLEVGSAHLEPPLKCADHGTQITSLGTSIQQQLKSLEIAVIQARQEATRQKNTLDELKVQAESTTTSTAQQRMAAMFATKSKLTAWLEDSLEKVQMETGSDDQEEVEGQANLNDPTEMELAVDKQYERYLEARRALLSAVAALKTELPEMKSGVSKIGPKTKQHHTEEPQQIDTSPVLNVIEKSLLPAKQQHHLTQTYLRFAEEQLANESASVVKIIDRLSDESQLLQAFPMLAHSGRFQHAVSVFGNNSKTEAQVADEVSRGVEPWLFSAEAADVAARSAISKHVDQGTEAMESVSRNLTALQLLREANDLPAFSR